LQENVPVKIIIVGAGEVGFHLAKKLSFEKHDLVIIEENPEQCKKIEETLDISVVHGSGSDQKVLKDAGIDDADMLIAASGVDEVNIIASMIAWKSGVRLKVARVRNRDYYSPSSILKQKDLGIDLFIHPEDEVKEEIVSLLMRATASEIVSFENGKILFVGLKLDEQCPFLNLQLKDMTSEEMRRKFRIVAIQKADRTIIPTGDDYINKNDQIFVVTREENLSDLLAMTGKSNAKLEKIMILGGGKIGSAVAANLEDKGLDVTVVESDKEKSLKLAEELKRATVVQADGAEIDMLVREGLRDADGFVAVTSDDETNIIACLLAKHLGIRKVIALVSRSDYVPLMSVIGIDSTVNMRLATAKAILRFIRRGDILSVALFHGIEAEAIEFEVKKGNRLAGKPLKKLSLPDGSLVAAIVRGEDAFVPHGENIIEQGDKVIFFALPQAIRHLEGKFS